MHQLIRLALALALGLAPAAVRAQSYPTPTFNSVTLLNLLAASRTQTSYPMTPLITSAAIVNYAVGAGPSFNTKLTSTVYAAGFGHWTSLNQVLVGGAATVGQNVASYSQAINYSVDGVAADRQLWAGVFEVRDDSHRPSSTGSLLRGLEIDVIGDGLDDRVGDYGRVGITIVAGQSTVSTTDTYVSQGINLATFQSPHVIYKSGYTIGSPFSGAVFDTRNGTQLSGANAVWLKSGHRLSLATAGSVYLYSDGTFIQTPNSAILGGDAGGNVELFINSAAASDRYVMFTAGGVGTRNFQIGVDGATGNFIVGRYVAGVFTDSPLKIAPATGNLTVLKTLLSSGAVATGANAASLSLTTSAIGLSKMTASAAAPGATGGKLELVCGTGAGTAKLVVYAGTSGTAVTVTDNIGGGVTGC